MKDAYSFDADFDGLQKSYAAMYDAYTRIFTRLGLKFRAVAADTGEIGGTGSHEFQVLAGSGEDAIAYCAGFGLRRERRARRGARACASTRDAATQPMTKVATPGKHTCEEVSEFLETADREDGEVDRRRCTTTTMRCHAARARRPHAERGQGVEGRGAEAIPLRDATARSARASRRRPGSLGPVGHDSARRRRSHRRRDERLRSRRQRGRLPPRRASTGAATCPSPEVADIRNVVAGDPSPDGKGTLEIARGIEVGPRVPAAHRRTPSKMGVTYHRREGRAAADGDGLLRHRHHAHRRRGDRAEPRRARHRVSRARSRLSRFAWCRSATTRTPRCARRPSGSYAELLPRPASTCCLRTATTRPGVLFADMDLIGIPHRLVLSERGLAAGSVEYKGRARGRAVENAPLASARATSCRSGSSAA